MSISRSAIIGLVALLLSGLVTALLYQTLKNRFSAKAEDSGQILVAASSLTVGQRIEEADIYYVAWPKGVEIKGSFRDAEEVVGRGVLVPIEANEPILESKLAARGGGTGLTSTIPTGKRAISVRVDDIVGVAGFVLPGTRVDLILSGSPEQRNSVEISRVILENIEVLAAGQNLEKDANGKAQEVQVITLLVTPEEAQVVALAQNDGQIQLALRNPLDLQHEEPKAVHKRTLYGQSPPAPKRNVVQRTPKPPAPPPSPVILPALFEVELIQGSNREKLQFDASKRN